MLVELLGSFHPYSVMLLLEDLLDLYTQTEVNCCGGSRAKVYVIKGLSSDELTTCILLH